MRATMKSYKEQCGSREEEQENADIFLEEVESKGRQGVMSACVLRHRHPGARQQEICHSAPLVP